MTLPARHCLQKRYAKSPWLFLPSILNRPQEQCVLNCADKFLKHSERVGQRFAELNAGSFLSIHPSLPEFMARARGDEYPQAMNLGICTTYQYVIVVIVPHLLKCYHQIPTSCTNDQTDGYLLVSA